MLLPKFGNNFGTAIFAANSWPLDQKMKNGERVVLPKWHHTGVATLPFVTKWYCSQPENEFVKIILAPSVKVANSGGVMNGTNHWDSHLIHFEEKFVFATGLAPVVWVVIMQKWMMMVAILS